MNVTKHLMMKFALLQAIRYPKSGYRYLLDVIGKHFDNPLVELYRRRFPYHEIEQDPDTGMILFKHEELVKLVSFHFCTDLFCP